MADSEAKVESVRYSKVIECNTYQRPDPELYDVGDILIATFPGWGTEQSVYMCVNKGINYKSEYKNHPEVLDIRKRWCSLTVGGQVIPDTIRKTCPHCKEVIEEIGKDSYGRYTKTLSKSIDHLTCNKGS